MSKEQDVIDTLKYGKPLPTEEQIGKLIAMSPEDGHIALEDVVEMFDLSQSILDSWNIKESNNDWLIAVNKMLQARDIRLAHL